MSNFTGIGQTTKVLRKYGVYRQVDDSIAPTLPPAPVRQTPLSPVISFGDKNPVAASSQNGAYYLKGTNQWGQEIVLYVPPNPNTVNLNIPIG